MSPPSIIVGTANWGHYVNETQIRSEVSSLKGAGVKQLDSAALYPPTNPGQAETLLGAIGHEKQGFLIDTKVMYMNQGSGTLTESAVESSLEKSLANLKTDKVNILYAQGPDHVTPIPEQAAAFDKQYRKGKFAKLGLCNFSPEDLQQWLQVADEKGYVKPSVYQGQYNLLSRAYEDTLFPLLRKHNIQFYAFGPLAGGFLTGKLTLSKGADDLKGTRFEQSDGNVFGMAGRYWYDKPSFHTAVRKLVDLSQSNGLEPGDVAVRWLVHHSLLDASKGDAVIVGPRTPEQFNKYVAAWKDGPLPEKLASELGALFSIVKQDAATIVLY
ncbi:Aldo/keto reductase [Xylaria cf. heliscus]|nr:Aldo/keto reductase [Xylaria cf. heliscus]